MTSNCSCIWLIQEFRSTIIQEAEKLEDEANGLAYYYCDYKDPSTQNPFNILGCLIRQLAMQNAEAFKKAESFYKKRNPQGKQATQATNNDLAELLQNMSNHFENVMIIIDALDECSSDRSYIVELISHLVQPNQNSLKVIFTSRKEIDIEMHLSEFDQVSIAAKSSDLKLYVAAEIELRIRHKRLRLKDPSLKEYIMKRLVEGAEGM